MEPTHEQLTELLEKKKKSGAFDENEITQIDQFLTELRKISKPQKFDIEKYKKLLSEILKWIIVGEKVLKDIIDICTSRK